MPGYKSKEDEEKFKKAFREGNSKGESAAESLKRGADEVLSSAKSLLGMNDDEDEKKKKKN